MAEITVVLEYKCTFCSLLIKEDDTDGIHIVAFAEEEDPGLQLQHKTFYFGSNKGGHR